MSKFVFSLVMGTLGRDKDISIFIDSLLSQSPTLNWQLIVVDQNSDGRVDTIMSTYMDKIPLGCELLHVKTKIRGLSKARNLGLKQCKGNIIGFPDDDCVYSDNTLATVHSVFEEGNSDSLVVSLDDVDELPLLNNAADSLEPLKLKHEISSYNVFRDAISYTIFVSSSAKEHLFDEQLGVGCYFGAAEETDFIYRLKRKGWRLLKVRLKSIYHPRKDSSHSAYDRAYSYNLGIGAFFRKNLSFHDVGLMIFFVVSMLKLSIRILLNLLSFNKSELKWYWSIFSGRVIGLIKYGYEASKGL